jgi:general secretion pathway protein J
LIDEVRSLSFAYFGVAGPKQRPAWLDRWSERDGLPQLIRMRLILANGTQGPDLIVAPRLAQTAQP